ncbi:hypothetical protein DTO195F2_1384 [Paecilomyces variotii]|nr:hypothetical protein DTO195F2_1384 [Paecilomyces variotii]
MACITLPYIHTYIHHVNLEICIIKTLLNALIFAVIPMSPSRSASRNVFIYFSHQPGVVQGGLCAAQNLTRHEFIDMLNIAFRAIGGFEARFYGSNTPITRTNQPLQRGSYILHPRTAGEQVEISDEQWHPRTLSLSNTPTEDAFRDQVRTRDRRCVITGRINQDADVGIWTGFEAAHIFPLALDPLFISQGFAQLITYNDPPGVDSPQNGILLRADIHSLWDNYFIAINPNNGYRVQTFRPSTWDLQGNVLHTVCRQPGNPLSVIDALLLWHFEQAVLINMRGAGGPIFEFDFPPGTDMMGEIRRGPQPAERMEAELFNRLYSWREEQSSEHADRSRSLSQVSDSCS